MARPQGRPLAEHVWRDGGWYHAATGKPFNEEVYIAGVPHHRLKDASVVDHLVEMIEAKAAEIEAAKAAEEALQQTAAE